MRVVERTVKQIGPTTFAVRLRMTPSKPTVSVFCCLSWPKDDSDWGGTGHMAPMIFTYSGDYPKSGDVPYPNSTPTSGPLTPVYVGSGDVHHSWSGIEIGGTGLIDVYAMSDFITVGSLAGLSATWHIMKNGVSVASASQSYVSGSSWVPQQAVSITGLSVTTGDVIEHHVIVSDGRNVTAPAGVGQYIYVLKVTGDLA